MKDTEKTKAQLIKELNELRSVNDNVQDYIMRYDAEGRHTFANAACLRVSGMTAEDYLGKTHREMGFPEDLCCLWENAIEKTFETAEPQQEIFEWEGVDGAVTLDWRVVPEMASDGTVISVLAVSRDITERKRLEDQLLQSEKQEAIGQLAGGVAHDFNNQLCGIVNYAELLLSKTDDQELKSITGNIIQLCTRGGDLTDQLLSFSSKGTFETVPVSIHQSISEVVSILERSLDKRIAIRQLLEAHPATTCGDPTQLQNVLLNLGLNAGDAMPKGGDLVFTTSTDTLDEEYCSKSAFDLSPGDYLKVTVSDSGTGMSEAVQARAFEPFFTTKEEGKGTGMGLASVYGAIIGHQGALEVDSKVGQGTGMTVYLPLSQKDVQEKAAAAPEAAPKSVGARILFVDDEESVRKSTARLLRSLGYDALTSEDGGGAVEHYRTSWRDIDLVILDMNMPVLNGRDTFTAMREINPNIKAILATGYFCNRSVQEALDEGALSYIKKPFSVHDFVQQIEQTLHTAVTL